MAGSLCLGMNNGTESHLAREMGLHRGTIEFILGRFRAKCTCQKRNKFKKHRFIYDAREELIRHYGIGEIIGRQRNVWTDW